MLDIIASTLHCPIEILLLQTVLPRWLLLVLISYITLRFGDGNHIDMVFVAPSASSGCFWLFFSPPVSQEDENWLRSKYFTTAIPPTGKLYETTGHGKNSISTSILELGQCFFLLCIYRKIHTVHRGVGRWRHASTSFQPRLSDWYRPLQLRVKRSRQLFLLLLIWNKQ